MLAIGDRLMLSGGYYPEPDWLGGVAGVLGVVSTFIPGQGDTLAAVVHLDNALTVQDTTGDIVVLELLMPERHGTTRKRCMSSCAVSCRTQNLGYIDAKAWGSNRMPLTSA